MHLARCSISLQVELQWHSKKIDGYCDTFQDSQLTILTIKRSGYSDTVRSLLLTVTLFRCSQLCRGSLYPLKSLIGYNQRLLQSKTGHWNSCCHPISDMHWNAESGEFVALFVQQVRVGGATASEEEEEEDMFDVKWRRSVYCHPSVVPFCIPREVSYLSVRFILMVKFISPVNYQRL